MCAKELWHSFHYEDSLHDGMREEVTVDGQMTPEFDVCNGLRQGCVIAPTLFNLYFVLVMKQWRSVVSLEWMCSTYMGER